MVKNDSSWFPEDNSWLKTTTHGQNDPAMLTSVAKAMEVKKLRRTSPTLLRRAMPDRPFSNLRSCGAAG